MLLVPVDAIIVEEDSQRLMTGFNKLQRVQTVVTDRHRMSIRQGENWGEFYNLQSDPTEVNNLFDEASAEQIRATLTETMLGQIIELQGWAPLLAYRALVPPGARRQFKTRISLLAQPNFTPPISGAKVLADASISASAS